MFGPESTELSTSETSGHRFFDKRDRLRFANDNSDSNQPFPESAICVVQYLRLFKIRATQLCWAAQSDARVDSQLS
jgi:hypothetical protein